MSTIGGDLQPGIPGDMGPTGLPDDPAPASAPTASAASTATRSTGTGSSRASVLSSLATPTPDASGALPIPGTSASIAPDGTIVGPGGPGGPLAVLNELALRPTDGPGPFDGVSDVALLRKVATKLAETHAGLRGTPPDDKATLAWRQSRGAALHLLEEAAVRAHALGDARGTKAIVGTLMDAVKSEPYRFVRDFTYESLVSRAETGALPEVREARGAIYPETPPYDKWLENGQIDITLYADDDGSPIENQVRFFQDYLGFKHTENPDGSHTLRLDASRGKPAIEITMPPKDGEPALFEKMDDDEVDVIAYTGHAGYGHRVDHALSQGVGGTGEDKLVVLFQCWGEGNIESLARAYPDAKMLSTTDATTDYHDWIMWSHMIKGFRQKGGYEPMHAGAAAELKRELASDPEYAGKDWDKHFFDPTTRSVLAERFDRDGDGVSDSDDHVFNVIYPKRIDSAGGYDPVVQPVPDYALDGTQLNRSVGDLSLAIRYNHLLPPDVEAKLPWKPEQWRTGGFFTPEPGDLRAFQFDREADGTVRVALSTQFAHTQQEDLSRLLAFEAGLWLGEQAGVPDADRLAMGVALSERIVHQQGAWYQTDGMLDEPWAEEALFMDRYGLSGFTFGDLEAAVGDPDEYGPEHFEKVRERIAALPGAADLASRAPTRVGQPLEIPADPPITLGASYLDPDIMKGVLDRLGVSDAEVLASNPSWLQEGQPNNLVCMVKKGDDTFQVSLGVDSEGMVRNATRLDLDLSKKVDAMVDASLSQFAENVEGLEASTLRIAYHRALEGGKPFHEAMLDALKGARTSVPMGTGSPDTWQLSELASAGLVSPADVEALSRGVEDLFGSQYPERTVAEWAKSVAGAAGVDPAALERAYLTEVAKGDGAAGRARGLEALLKMLPSDIGPGSTLVNELYGAFAGDRFIAAGQRDAVRALLDDRLGLDRNELAGQALGAVIGQNDDGGPEAARRLTELLSAGRPLAEAVTEVVRAHAAERPNLYMYGGIEVFESLGVVEKGSEEHRAVAAALHDAGREINAHQGFAGWATEVASDPALSERYAARLKAAGGDGRAAVLETLRRERSLKGAALHGLPHALRLVPPGERAAFAEEVLKAAGQTREAAVRGLVERPWPYADPLPAEKLAEFDQALSGGGSLGEAVAAHVRARAAADDGVDIDTLLSSGLLDGADLKAATDAEREAGARAGSGLTELLYDIPNGDSLKEAYERAIERGASVEDATLALIRDLPTQAFQPYLWSAFGSALAEHGPEVGGRLMGALAERMGTSQDDAVMSMSGLAGDSLPTMGDSGGPNARRQAFLDARAAGASYGDALAASVRAAADGEQVWVNTDGLTRLGYISPSEGRALSLAASLRTEGPGTFAQMVQDLLGGGEAPAQLTERVTAAVASPDPAAALVRVFADTAKDRGLTLADLSQESLGTIDRVLSAVPDAGRRQALDGVLSALGADRTGFATWMLDARMGETPAGSRYSFGPALEQALATSGDLGSAIASLVDRLEPAHRSPEFLTTLVGSGLLTEAEQETVRAAFPG